MMSEIVNINKHFPIEMHSNISKRSVHTHLHIHTNTHTVIDETVCCEKKKINYKNSVKWSKYYILCSLQKCLLIIKMKNNKNTTKKSITV